MSKSIPFIFLFLFIQSNSAKAEEAITFWFEECLKKSTHIFKGVVIDDKGTINIYDVLKGKCRLKQIRLPELPQVNKYGGYGPSDSFINWELIVFLKQDSLQKNVYGPTPIIEQEGYDYTGFNQALTTLWVKRDTAYAGFQIDIPGDVNFSKWGPISHYLDRIENNNYFHKKFSKIKHRKNCKKKMRLLNRLHSDSRYSNDAYTAIVELDCPEQALEFFYQRLPKDTFTYQHSRDLRHYIGIGQYKVIEQIDAIFEKEFTFWKTYIPSHPEDDWWYSNNELNPRFTFFKTIVIYFIGCQIGDSTTKVNQVYSYFDTLKEYNQANNIQTIQKRIDYRRELNNK